MSSFVCMYVCTWFAEHDLDQGIAVGAFMEKTSQTHKSMPPTP